MNKKIIVGFLIIESLLWSLSKVQQYKKQKQIKNNLIEMIKSKHKEYNEREKQLEDSAFEKTYLLPANFPLGDPFGSTIDWTKMSEKDLKTCYNIEVKLNKEYIKRKKEFIESDLTLKKIIKELDSLNYLSIQYQLK